MTTSPDVEAYDLPHHEEDQTLNLPAVDHNHIPHSTSQNNTSPSTFQPSLSNAIMHQQSEAAPIQPAGHQTEHVDKNWVLDSTTPYKQMHQFDPHSLLTAPILHQPPPTNQSNTHIPYNFPVHQAPPTLELSPQVRSDFSMQTPLPMNPLNLHNITQAVPNMSSAMTMFPQFHSAPQNHNSNSASPICQWIPQNLFNGNHTPQPQTLPELSSDLQLFGRHHSVNHPSFNSEVPINVHTNTEINRGAWSEEEHLLFCLGEKVYEKGEWKKISENLLPTRTPSQIASHAQKYYMRKDGKGNGKRRRKSIFDLTLPSDLPEPHYEN